ncbi:MAG: FCSD flavin-binding domain-containing protein [Pseudomonadales bacterium]
MVGMNMGSTAARYLRQLAPELDVTLVEPTKHYVACPFSNLVVAGQRSIEAQTFNYTGLEKAGVKVVTDTAVAVDPDSRQVRLSAGEPLAFDRLILGPGIDFRWNALPGYNEASSGQMPHAWKAGAQTILLARQLAAMPDNGLVVISVPAAPFRCPPGPYERASLIANYLQKAKPRAKLILLDSNSKFSKQPLFEKIWAEQYAGIVERRDPFNDGVVREVNPDAMSVHMDFESLQADVANIIPPQQAGVIAQQAGVVDRSGWCPINATTFESKLIKHVHVIGDATIAAPMPKSAFSANAQAKVCAIQVLRMLAGLKPQATTLLNTCYSFVDAEAAISVSGVYHNKAGSFSSVPGAGGTSPINGLQSLKELEGQHARDWFAAITQEVFG